MERLKTSTLRSNDLVSNSVILASYTLCKLFNYFVPLASLDLVDYYSVKIFGRLTT